MKKIIILIVLIFTNAFTPIAAKFTVAEISPLSLAFLRFGTAAILLHFVFLFKKQSYKIVKSDIPIFLVLGALVIPINQFFFLNGVKLSLASHSGISYACTPLFAFIIMIFLKKEVFSFRKIFPILLTIVGIFFVFYDAIMKSTMNNENILTGDILLFFAVLSWAMYITLNQGVVAKYGALKTSVIAFTIGMILYIPVFLFDVKNLTLDKLTIPGILGFIHLTFFVAFGAYFLFVYASKFIKVTELTTVTNLSPVVTIVFAWILLKEDLSSLFIAGAIITITGVFLSQIKNEQKSNVVN